MANCLFCGKNPKRASYKYCSNKCQFTYQYHQYIKKWKEGSASRGRGVRTKNVSKHIRRYLLEKYDEKCSLCGWRQKHPVTGTVPLEIDHLNGDSDNNSEENLRLLCPNCHSLSPNFRNLNKGKGRAWRIAKYHKNQIFDKI